MTRQMWVHFVGLFDEADESTPFFVSIVRASAMTRLWLIDVGVVPDDMSWRLQRSSMRVSSEQRRETKRGNRQGATAPLCPPALSSAVQRVVQRRRCVGGDEGMR